MFLVATITAALAAALVLTRGDPSRRSTLALRAPVAVLALLAIFLVAPGNAHALIVPGVDLGTADDYSVLAGTTITNTGPSELALNAGVWPDAAVVGFPPGLVLGVTEVANGVSLQAQSDLTAAYIDTANRPVNVTTSSELGGLTLVGGVYGGPSNSPLEITGDLVLDAEGDPNAVFIFQTGSTLITASDSTVSLTNGAQECNVFWQVGSSATLGTDSVFSGNILALTSISVTTGATVHGRALARNGAVTLDNNLFTTPTCDLSSATTTTTADTTVTTVAGGGGTTLPGGGGSTLPGGGTTIVPSRRLPSTGSSDAGLVWVAAASIIVGWVTIRFARRGETLGR